MKTNQTNTTKKWKKIINPLKFVSLLTVKLFLLFPLSSQSQTNINVPGSETGGNLIGDILLADGKILAYSPKEILIFDADADTLEHSIPISNTGKFNPRYFGYNKHICDVQLMTYNPNRNEVYYVSPDLKLHYIDMVNCSTGVLLGTTPDSILHFKHLNGPTNLKFDYHHNKLYWVIRGRSNENSPGTFHVMDSYIAVYDLPVQGSNPSLSKIWDYFIINNSTGNNYYNSFENVVFCEDNNSFFLAKKKRIDRYEIVNNSSVVFKESFNTRPCKLSKMLYIKNSTIHKLLVFPYRLPYDSYEPPMNENVNYFIIDCSDAQNFTMDSIQSPSKRIIDAAFLPAQNDLIVCYSPDEFAQPPQLATGNDVTVYQYLNGSFVNPTHYQTNGVSLNNTTETLNRPIKITQYNNSTVLISKKDELIKFYKQSSTYIFESIKTATSNYFHSGTTYNYYKSYIINAAGGYIEIYDESMASDSIPTGKPIYHTVEIGTGKFAAYNRLHTHSTCFYIYDTENDTIITSNPIDGAIGDIIFNPLQNHILVSENTDPGKISYFDTDGQFIGYLNFPSSDIDFDYIRDMFINRHNMLLVMTNMNNTIQETYPRLLVYKAADYSFVQEISNITMQQFNHNFHFYNAHFCDNTANGKTYITLCPGPPYDNAGQDFTGIGTPDPYLSTDNDLKFNPFYQGSNNGWLMEYTSPQSGIPGTLQSKFELKFPKELIYIKPEYTSTDEDKGLLFINAEKLLRYDFNSTQPTEIEASFYQVCYSKIHNKLFGINDRIGINSSNRIIQIHTISTSGIVSNELLAEVPGQASAFFINPFNEFLYLCIKIDNEKLGEDSMRLMEIDPLGLEQIQTTHLDNTCVFPDLCYDPEISAYYYNFITPYIDSANHSIYLPGGGHSNITAVDFEPADFLKLENNEGYITWLSFPRLNRSGNNAVSVDEALLDKVNPAYSDTSRLNFEQELGYFSTYDFDNHTWDGSPGGLYNVISSNGYILDLEYGPFSISGPIWLHLRGQRLAPGGANIILDDEHETWAGYWLTQPQHPMYAIPDAVLTHLYQVQGQYWSCYKYWDEGINMPYWLCACSKGRGTLMRYGDMVKLYSNSSLPFTWLNNTGTTSQEERPATEYFSFSEQPDYTSIFIELDSTENPLEIGAFIGETCVGATSVFSSDTLVLVQAYTQGYSGEISFQEYFGNKSAPDNAPAYFIWDESSGKWVQRNIHTAMHQKGFLVSFKDSKTRYQTNPESTAWLRCQPNPAKGSCSIIYYVSRETQISLKAYDLHGNPLKELYEGFCRQGQYEISWDMHDQKGAMLPPGIYYIRLQSGIFSESRKVIKL
ncbi:MAG: T9SS type A sorting domain-containing protein [Bacteroidetes bacterium]|nr:T9SS type A sorting domain-containing protein [Bacteroidota bacterium]